MEYRDVTVLESLKHVSMGMERWGFLFSVMSSPIVYFLTTLLAVCPNINPTILCAHVYDVNYAACYCTCVRVSDHTISYQGLLCCQKKLHYQYIIMKTNLEYIM